MNPSKKELLKAQDALVSSVEKLHREILELRGRLRRATSFIEEWSNYWAYGMDKPDGARPTAEDDARAISLGTRAADMVIDNRRFLAGSGHE